MAKGAVRGRPGTARDSWRGSWRVALTSARREVGRSRGRSLLILLLIGLPVFGLCAAGVALVSVSASAAESADQRMGRAPAVVVPAQQDTGEEFASSEPVATADGDVFGQVTRGGFASMDRQRPARLLVADGFSRESAWTQERVESTVGSPVLPTAVVPLSSVDGKDLIVSPDEVALPALVADTSSPLFEGRGQLVSGRWPTGPGEIAVTEVGADGGLPRRGLVTVALGEDEAPRDLRVVGVAKAQAGQRWAAAVLHPTAAPEGTAWQWAVDRTEALPFDEALGWTDYGLSVMSRAVLLDPPPEEQDSAQTVTALVIAMLVLGVLIETMFLAGPAFAISTTRRQRSMALASAQGAGPADLRRQVLGYAVVLAALAAAVGALLGVGAGLAVAVYLRRRSLGSFLPLEVPWVPLLGIVVLAVLAAALAAWWPARGVAHLDTMAVLRGRSVSRPVRRGMPLVGGAMVAVGAVLAVLGAGNPSGGQYALVAAGALTFFGTVLLIPLLLVFAGRLAERLPTAARLAVRDATRQRGRSVPAVAAIAAAVALVAGLSTVVASSAVAERLNYKPNVAIGAATVSLERYDDNSPEVTTADPQVVQSSLAESVPEAHVWAVGSATGTPGVSRWDEPTEGTTGTLWGLYSPDCSVDQVTLGPFDDGPCGLGANAFSGSFGAGIVVLPSDALASTTGLGDAAVRALDDGAVLVQQDVLPTATPHTVLEAPTLSGQATVVFKSEYEPSLQPSGELSPGTIPAYVLDNSEFFAAFPNGGEAVAMTLGTAEGLGLTVETERFVVAAPNRALTQAEAAAATTAVEAAGGTFYVERGYQREGGEDMGTWIVLAALGLVALAATVIVTALTITDNARDSAVLAAVGGTSRLRRRWASWYALVIAGFGVALGMVVGIAMGLACGWWATAARYGFEEQYVEGSGGVLSLAWPALGMLALLPLLGALIAWLSVRGTPHLLQPTV